MDGKDDRFMVLQHLWPKKCMYHGELTSTNWKFVIYILFSRLWLFSYARFNVSKVKRKVQGMLVKLEWEDVMAYNQIDDIVIYGSF